VYSEFCLACSRDDSPFRIRCIENADYEVAAIENAFAIRNELALQIFVDTGSEEGRMQIYSVLELLQEEHLEPTAREPALTDGMERGSVRARIKQRALDACVERRRSLIELRGL
jgi:hypothetical protein